MALEVPNRLICSLSAAGRESILTYCTPVDLPIRTPLYDAEERPRYAYFMTAGLASIVMTTEEGETAEVGLVGREGLVGGLHLIGPAKISTSSFIQIGGTALRMPWAELKRLYSHTEEIRDRIVEFQQEQALVISQIAGCNRLHEVEARLARWLLMGSDQTGSDMLGLTQEFIGMMLGARRTTVSLVAGTLQRLGMIEFSRGRVRILDREQMEEVACDCYRVVKGLHTNLYAKSPGDW